MEKLTLNLEAQADFRTREAYKTLRTNLLLCGQDCHVVAVTSCGRQEGKTTVTLHLARSLTELGKKVLVIDADMRASVMAARYAGIDDPPGLSQVLTGAVTPMDSIHATRDPGLHLIFSGAYPPNPVELLSGGRFRALIAQSRKVYDYVLIDTPPLGWVIDAAVAAPHCDGVILVMADGAVRADEARKAAEQLRRSGSRILGVVRCSARRKRDKNRRNRRNL